MNLNELAKEVHQNAVEHGWWEEERSFGDIISLCHSELSEALEEYRNKKEFFYYHYPQGYFNAESREPEGIAVELADCIIRILDYCSKENIDIDKIVHIKHEFNKTRPYKHGGKII
jgi:NTP pyrophosphatase (non-canonical NTP hydrolase)